MFPHENVNTKLKKVNVGQNVLGGYLRIVYPQNMEGHSTSQSVYSHEF